MAIQVRPNFSPSARGNRCSTCGADQRFLDVMNPALGKEQTVDLGILIDFEGEFEICEHCAQDIAKLIGYVPVSELEEVRALAEGWMAHATDMEQVVAEKQDVVNVLTREMAAQAHSVVEKEATRG